MAVNSSLTWATIDATTAHDRDAASWLSRQPGRTGLVL